MIIPAIGRWPLEMASLPHTHTLWQNRQFNAKCLVKHVFCPRERLLLHTQERNNLTFKQLQVYLRLVCMHSKIKGRKCFMCASCRRMHINIPSSLAPPFKFMAIKPSSLLENKTMPALLSQLESISSHRGSVMFYSCSIHFTNWFAGDVYVYQSQEIIGSTCKLFLVWIEILPASYNGYVKFPCCFFVGKHPHFNVSQGNGISMQVVWVF